MPLLSYADGMLRLITDKTQVELGTPVQATIIASNINTSISLIDISHLKNNFGLEIVESSNKLDDNNAIQELRINLYPRQPGSTQIESVQLGKYKSMPIDLVVNPAHVIGSNVTFESSYSAVSAWQRQQIRITSSVITTSKFARIELSDFNQEGIDTYKLKPTKKILSDGRYKITATWVLYPLFDGNQLFTPPSVNYWLSGKIQRKFFPPVKRLNIKKLPSYIPPLMPVGTLNVSSQLISSQHWHIALSSTDISPSTLSTLAIPLNNNTNIKFGNVESTTKLNDNFNNTVSIEIPLSYSRSGLYDLPELVYKTFNPHTGKIVTLRRKTDNAIFINDWLKVILSLLAAYLVYSVLSTSISYATNAINRYKNKKQILESLLHAQNPNELHSLLNKYAEIMRWGKNLSLNQWGEIWSRYENTSANDIIDELSLACYAKNRLHLEQNKLNKKVYDFITT